MWKRGLILFFILIGMLGFFFGHETQLTGLPVSGVGNITVNIISAVACTVSSNAQSISFGTDLDAGAAYNASQNYAGTDTSTSYNITNDATSTTTVNISIKGSDFISGSNRVGVGNISWTSNTTIGNGSNLNYPGIANISTSFDTTNRIALDEPIDSTVWYRLWLNIPSTTAAGTYTGNYTLRCSET